jgi:hypothetical protein
LAPSPGLVTQLFFQEAVRALHLATVAP